MITIQTKDGKEFAAKPATSLKKEYQGLVRDGIGLTLLDTTYQKAKNAFAEGQDFTILISDGENTESYEQVGYCLCAKITDNMDGCIGVELFKHTDEELIAEENSQAFVTVAGTDDTARAEALRVVIESLSTSLPDDKAVETPELFPEWVNNKDYKKDDRVKYRSLLYKCLSTHPAQESWNPADSPSLWVRMDDPAEEFPEWRQPLGSTDAYPLGAKVSHDGKHWRSTVEHNTWRPGEYGWDEVA